VQDRGITIFELLADSCEHVVPNDALEEVPGR